MESELTNILDFSYEELEDIVVSYGEPKYRAKQLFSWLAKGVNSFAEMLNVPSRLKASLENDYYIGLPELASDQLSANDGTRKCLFRFKDGSCVESVFMKYSYGNSICISSQVGCRMGCKFCASTLNGLSRNLTSGEMLSEILAMKRLTGEDIGHVVVMGIGEPFDNYDNLSKFLRLINDPRGYGLGMRNITVSTCGIIPNIERFGEEFPQVNLAVSLHAPNDSIRKRTMPISNKYSYDELMRACRDYTELTGRRITFEYAMIKDVNDSAVNAEELSSNIKGWLTHVNLIPLNEVSEREFKVADNGRINEFKRILESHNIAVTIRRTLGSDIDAACGQLRNRGGN